MAVSKSSFGFILAALVVNGCFLDRSGLAGDGSSDAAMPDASRVDASMTDAFVPPTDGGNDAGRDAEVIGEDSSMPMDACVATGPEVCEGSVDENCSGSVDEGCDCVNGMTRSCTPAGDACAATETCVDGSWDCVDDAPSRSCNGMDDDCDGDIDEDSGCSAATGCTFVLGSGGGAGSSYLFCGTSLTFAAARAVCQSYNYELTTIESAAESSWQRSQLSGGRWWIGLRANAWVSGSSSAYRDSGSPGGSECALNDDNAGDWGGDPCTRTYPFICEAPVP